MSDCVQMLRDWKRMCNAMAEMDGCEDCPIVRNTHGARCGDTPGEMQDVESIAREVEKWAAEHPEPIYPTWWEFINNEFTNSILLGENKKYNTIIEFMKHKPIPADIAEKLGIEPKEG